MQWELIVALVIAIPVVLFPVLFIWYLNVGGIVTAFRKAREKRTARNRQAGPAEKAIKDKEYEEALAEALRRFPW